MHRSSWFVALLTAGCSLSSVDTRIEQAQAVSRAIGTFHDFDLAKHAVASNLAELEGLHQLAPDNEALMLELVRAWVTHAELFAADDLETAVQGDNPSAQVYHRQRVATAYVRASFWAREWLGHSGTELDPTAPPAALESALNRAFTTEEDARPLLWLGHAFLGVALSGTNSDRASGSMARLMLKRSLELDETFHFASAHALLGRYYASDHDLDLEQSRKHFARAKALAGDAYLLTQLYQAISYSCRRGDRAEFQAALDEVLKTNDPAAQVRLQNAAAKRRAQRWSVVPALWQSCASTK